MDDLLYKVTEPSHGERFEPRPFWRTEDWAFSDDHPHDGWRVAQLLRRSRPEMLVEDHLLYAAEFDEVNIHLLPRVWRLRVWLEDPDRSRRLRDLGFQWPTDARAVLFVADHHRADVEAFAPTVVAFDRSGFERTPTKEFVSREAQTAVSRETIPIKDALARWHVEVIYLPDAPAIQERLRQADIDHQIQT